MLLLSAALFYRIMEPDWNIQLFVVVPDTLA
jgi:hypothetical protein